MTVVTDTCSLINLINGGVIREILSIPGYVFYIGNIVYDEVTVIQSQKNIIDDLINSGKIIQIIEDVPIHDFKILKKQYGLGDGETESIAHCKNNKYHISSDDQKARICGGKELSETSVIGSLFLLREAVRLKIINCNDAKSAYLLMKIQGGFLPTVDESYLCQ